MYYTGIGSRETPPETLELMLRYSEYLALKGYGLRSGGAKGADSAFQSVHERLGVEQEIFIPWNGFQGLYHDPQRGIYLASQFPNWEVASRLASHHHPVWERLSQGARALHTRNVYQILGPTLNQPSVAVVCWAPILPHSQVKGGTGLAVRLALSRQIPVFNLYAPEIVDKIQKLLEN